MKLLLDTHLLLWAASTPEALSAAALELIEDKHNALYFSPASLWEINIKNALGRPDFQVDARLLRRGLMDNDYIELPITSEHTVFLANLPPLHKDPFDRILIAQASVAGIMLVTADAVVASYPGSIKKV
jgi:PIN domain nuclease of toxin-antitoxin system